LSEDPDAFPCSSFAVAAAIDRAYCGSAFGEIEERDLRTGQLTAVRLDPQLGEVGDLAVAEDRELVAFARGYYRWRLDGSGLVSRLVAPGAMTTAGYDDAGRYLAVSPRGAWREHLVLDLENGTDRAVEDGDSDVMWLGGQRLMVLDDSGSRIVDVASGDSVVAADARLARAEMLLPGGDGEHAWFVPTPRGDAPWTLEEFDVATAEPTGLRLEVPGFPYRMRASPDGSSAWVSYQVEEGSHLNWEDEDRGRAALFDLESGAAGPEATMVVTAAWWDHDRLRVVGSDYAGLVQEYDAETAASVATLPGSRGALQDLTVSDDGRRLLSAGQDGNVQVFDTRSWTRLGAIPSFAPEEVTQGYLRPDGLAVAVNGRLGVTEWTLHPEDLAAAACTLAGRNLSHTEWATYFGDEGYRRTCPDYPSGEGSISPGA
ncbi:MAG: hypothetical protein LH468_01310, partial [Nocardioides sp.]|nr:hypothetical protein [Nocardioides sp.]